MNLRHAILLIVATVATCTILLLPSDRYSERGVRENALLAAESVFFHKECEGQLITVDLVSGFYSERESQSKAFEAHLKTSMAELAEKSNALNDEARANLCADLDRSITRRMNKYGYR
jgi:hypothetical protein